MFSLYYRIFLRSQSLKYQQIYGYLLLKAEEIIREVFIRSGTNFELFYRSLSFQNA